MEVCGLLSVILFGCVSEAKILRLDALPDANLYTFFVHYYLINTKGHLPYLTGKA